jgi:exosortase
MSANETRTAEGAGNARLMHVAAISAIGLFFVLMNYGVMRDLVTQWIEDTDFTHGFFVPVIAGYFVWDRREDLARIEPRPSLWGLGLVVFAIMVRVLSIPTNPLYPQALSMVLMLGGLVWYLGGWQTAKIVAFPVAFLVLMIPPPGVIFTKIAVFLQGIATESSAVLLNLLGVQAHTEGNVLQLSNAVLEVARACSGIRSLVGLVTMGVAFSYVVTRYNWERAVLVASTIPIAILCNILRVTITAILYSADKEDWAVGFMHQFEGVVMFAVALGMLFCVERVLKMLFVEEEKRPGGDAVPSEAEAS